MAKPDVRRDGDTWLLTWPEDQIGLGVERLRESSDGLHAEIVVESTAPGSSGRVHGPVKLNLLSSDSQTRLANVLTKRVNHTDWASVVTQACAIVAREYRAPTPTLNLADYEDDGEVEWLIPGFLPKNETTILYGDGESGKSLLALLLSLRCRTGGTLPWGAAPSQQANVLYLDWETNPRTVKSRLKRLAWDLEAVPQIHYRQMFRSLEEEVPNLRYEISQLGIDLVVVDSIGFACSGPLTEDQTARGAINALRALSPATRLVVAHISQEAARATSGPVRPFGSAFFWNGMRSGWEVRKAQDQPLKNRLEVGLYHRKANDGEHSVPVGLSVTFMDTGAVVVRQTGLEEVPELAERMSLSARLRFLLRSGEKDTATLAQALDAKPDTVARTLDRAAWAMKVSGGGGRGNPTVWGIAKDG